jgi:gliding motility-associated-like protein
MDKTVKQWFWDFGDGLNKGDSLITKTYHVEGNKPLILIGQTNYGCKDTIRRPFRVYDNKAFAGRDTITAIDEPVQLHAHGGPGVTYTWSPATGLNNPTLENPVAILDRDQRYRLDALTLEGCDSHSDILIKRFKGPELYIPTAFTPNGDGKNDVLKVFPVGMRAFHYLAVYNRYGEMVFKTTDYGTGWDGTYKGIKQGTETFVVVAQAIDYRGKLFLKKGTVTVIR